VSTPNSPESLLREFAPQVLGIVARRFDGFDACEDAVQEALVAAARQWPTDGVPDNPIGWLVRVASRRRTELWRSESARRRREETAFARQPSEPAVIAAVDDTLTVFLLCCRRCRRSP